MKIALVTNFLYPEGLGGTELFCYKLAKALIQLNNEVFWFVPNWSKAVTSTSNFEDIHIVRFAVVEKDKKSNQDFVAASFIKEIKARQISVAHFNEFGGPEGSSANLLNATKASGIHTVVTLHLLNYLCRQGLMRHVNKENNSGEIAGYRCGECLSQSKKSALASQLLPVLKLYAKTNLPVQANLNKNIDTYNDKLPLVEALKNSADVIVTLTKWFQKVLIANNVESKKIVHIPQGEPEILVTPSPLKKTGFVFISRIHKEKGIDILLKTAEIFKERKLNITIDLYGPIPVGIKHSIDFITKIKVYKNIQYKGVLPPSDVIKTISRYKAVLLPSIVAEMAPMIIMEANKLQTPVIATDVPGSRELITEYNCGLITKYNNAEDFSEKIIQIEKGQTNFSFIQPHNSFDVVAQRYLKIYIPEIQKRN